MLPNRLLLLTALLSAGAQAQWLSYPERGDPRTPDGKVNLTAPSPRANGKPDLSGVWHMVPTPVAELRRIFGPFVAMADKLTVPGMGLEDVNKYFLSVLADYKPDQAPVRPEGMAALREGASRPMKVCLPAGPLVPHLPDPHKILQTQREIIILYEADGSHRQIYTDGRPFPKEFLQPSWQGFSIGKWEGDTLVVETAGFNDKTPLDLLGHPHSDALRVTERYHRRDFGHMDVEMTMDDPRYYTQPFTIKYSEMLMPDTDVLESVCNENEKDVVHTSKQQP